MLTAIKDKKFELLIFVVMVVVSLIGHYYLSWRDYLTGDTKLIVRFLWMITMVVIGYYGLTRHEITTVKYIWILWYILVFTAFLIDKVLLRYYSHAPLFGVASYQFTSPFPYAVACILPRIVKSQLKKKST